MITSTFKIKKMIVLLLQLITYSFGISLVMELSGITHLGMKGLIKTALPVTFDQYWFATAYVVIYLLSPFINKLLCKLSEKEYLKFLGVMFVLWTVIPTLTSGRPGANYYTIFLFLYSLGGFVRRFDLPMFQTKRYGVYGAILLSIISIASIIGLNVLGVHFHSPSLLMRATKVVDTYSVFASGIALSLFIWAKNVSMKSNRWINMIASATFGVYLVHDNKNMRNYLWTQIFHTKTNLADTPLHFAFYAIGVVAVVFLSGVVIELIRKQTLERLTNKLIDLVQYKYKVKKAVLRKVS
jgi:surface polysaccharide O-acyltransferase-like enzyme